MFHTAGEVRSLRALQANVSPRRVILASYTDDIAFALRASPSLVHPSGLPLLADGGLMAQPEVLVVMTLTDERIRPTLLVHTVQTEVEFRVLQKEVGL